MSSTAAPHHAPEPGLAPVIAFRPRNDALPTQPPSRITWATRAELVEHAAYREIPSGRVGWYLGEAPVSALARLELGDSVLVFRSRGDGQLFTYSLVDALRGVALEEFD